MLLAHVSAPRLGASNDWVRPGSPAVRKWPSKSNDNSAPVLSSESAPILGIASAAKAQKAVASVTSRDDTALLRVRRESATRGPGRYLGPSRPLSAREQRDLQTSSAVFVQPTRVAPEGRKLAEPAIAMIWSRVNGPVECRDPTDRTSIRVTHDRSPHRYASVFGMQTRRTDPAARVTTCAAVGPGRYDASADGLSTRVTDSARGSAQFLSLTGRSTDAIPSRPSTAAAAVNGRRNAGRLDIVRTLEEDPRPELAGETLKKGPKMLLMMSESCVSVARSHQTASLGRGTERRRAQQQQQHRSRRDATRVAPFGSKGPRFARPRSCMEAWETHEGQLRRVDQSGYVGPGAYEPDLQSKEQMRPSSSFSAQPRGELFKTRTPAVSPDLGRWPLGSTNSRDLVFRESVFVD